MHELSVARAVQDLARQYVPPGGSVRRLAIRVGAQQAIEQTSMDLAWAAATMNGPWAEAALELEYLPWTLRCQHCGRQWTSHDPLATCSCGANDCTASGSAELTLLWIDVDLPGEETADVAAGQAEQPAHSDAPEPRAAYRGHSAADVQAERIVDDAHTHR